MYSTDFRTLWEKARVGWSERTVSKHVYYQVWNRSPVQFGCMRQVLGAGALGWPRGMGWGRRWEGGSGWRTHVNPWLIHVNVWQKTLQYCKVISLQLIKINGKKINFIKPQSLRPFFLSLWVKNIHITLQFRYLTDIFSKINKMSLTLQRKQPMASFSVIKFKLSIHYKLDSFLILQKISFRHLWW